MIYLASSDFYERSSLTTKPEAQSDFLNMRTHAAEEEWMRRIRWLCLQGRSLR
ncbi:unnamed protein product [Brassica oleracea]